MSGTPPAGSPTPALHSGQWLIVRSKTTPHLKHFLRADGCFTARVSNGDFVEGGISACEIRFAGD